MGRKSLIAALVLGFATAQTAGNACLPATILSAYQLTPQASAINSNGTCKDYHSTNGACATPGSVSIAMTYHNNWLASKAIDAQMYGLQYINATIYFQQQNKVITSSTTASNTNTSWWNSFTNTLSGWWSTISNRATALFQQVYGWMQDVFNRNMQKIPACLSAWGNITNGAYCLTSSSNSFPYRTDLAGWVGDLAWGVDQTTTGAALAECDALIDTYCQLTYGRSTQNNSMPFNQTFNWADGAISVDTCNNLRTYKNCNGNTCQPNLYQTYIDIFESYFIRFIPSRASINNLGNHYASNKTVNEYVSVQAASSGKSFKLYTAASNGANIRSIGGNSGQPWVNYNPNSAARFAVALVFALFALLF